MTDQQNTFQPPTPEPVKKSKKWPWIVGVIVFVFVCLWIIGNLVSQPDEGSTTAAASSAPVTTEAATVAATTTAHSPAPTSTGAAASGSIVVPVPVPPPAPAPVSTPLAPVGSAGPSAAVQAHDGCSAFASGVAPVISANVAAGDGAPIIRLSMGLTNVNDSNSPVDINAPFLLSQSYFGSAGLADHKYQPLYDDMKNKLYRAITARAADTDLSPICQAADVVTSECQMLGVN